MRTILAVKLSKQSIEDLRELIRPARLRKTQKMQLKTSRNYFSAVDGVERTPSFFGEKLNFQKLSPLLTTHVAADATFKHNMPKLKIWISFTIPHPESENGGRGETLLNKCIAHSNSADLLLSNIASDWLSGE